MGERAAFLDNIIHEDSVRGWRHFDLVRLDGCNDDGSINLPATEYVGPRGGRKIPLRIEWRSLGAGIFAKVFVEHPMGGSVLALAPFVIFHNDKGRVSRMWLEAWEKKTGIARIPAPGARDA